MKKYCTFLLSLLLCCVLTLSAYAAEPETSGSCGVDLKWSYESGVLTIRGKGEMADYEESRMPPWNAYAADITQVELPEKISKIGSLAFYGCTGLQSITLPNAVTSVGSYAFAECTALQSADLGQGLAALGEGTFQECVSLAQAELPASLQTLGTKAFYRCESLRTVTVPGAVTSMGPAAFAYCTGLLRAVVDAPLEQLPAWSFYGCTSLADVELADATAAAGEYAFSGCEQLGGVYSKNPDADFSAGLLDSITSSGGNAPSGSYVGGSTMPDSSTAVSANDTKSSQTTITENENSTLTTVKKTENGKDSTTIEADLKNNDGWDDIKNELEKNNTGAKPDVVVTPEGGKLNGKDLGKLAGENATVTVRGENDLTLKIDMADKKAEDFGGRYTVGAEVSAVEAGKTSIASEQVYQVKFQGKLDFGAQVGLQVGNALQNATLYQKHGKDFEKLQTALVDENGVAWFSLANVDKGNSYYIGINSSGLSQAEAIVPDSLTEQYGIDASLTDANGTQYQVTGRASRWGISGGRFALYVGVAVGALVVIVGGAMFVINKLSQQNAQYAAMAADGAKKRPKKEPKPVDENDLRVKVMRELLEEIKKKKEKK